MQALNPNAEAPSLEPKKDLFTYADMNRRARRAFQSDAKKELKDAFRTGKPMRPLAGPLAYQLGRVRLWRPRGWRPGL
mgnify:CR=1 FL=1